MMIVIIIIISSNLIARRPDWIMIKWGQLHVKEIVVSLQRINSKVRGKQLLSPSFFFCSFMPRGERTGLPMNSCNSTSVSCHSVFYSRGRQTERQTGRPPQSAAKLALRPRPNSKEFRWDRAPRFGINRLGSESLSRVNSSTPRRGLSHPNKK